MKEEEGVCSAQKEKGKGTSALLDSEEKSRPVPPWAKPTEMPPPPSKRTERAQPQAPAVIPTSDSSGHCREPPAKIRKEDTGDDVVAQIISEG